MTPLQSVGDGGLRHSLRHVARYTLIPEGDEEALAELEAELSADRSEVLRRLIRQRLDDWREERALDGLRDHSVTVRTAAELADVSDVAMLTLASEEGIDVVYHRGSRARPRPHLMVVVDSLH